LNPRNGRKPKCRKPCRFGEESYRRVTEVLSEDSYEVQEAGHDIPSIHAGGMYTHVLEGFAISSL
jgi:hypothetical protein